MSQIPAVNVVDPITPAASEASSVASLGARTALEGSLQMRGMEQQERLAEAEMAAQEEDRQWHRRMETKVRGQELALELARLNALRARSTNAAAALGEVDRAYREADDTSRKMAAATVLAQASDADLAEAVVNFKEMAQKESLAKKAGIQTALGSLLEEAADMGTSGRADQFLFGDLTSKGQWFSEWIEGAQKRATGRWMEPDNATAWTALLTEAWAKTEADKELDDAEVAALKQRIDRAMKDTPEEHGHAILAGLQRVASELVKNATAQAASNPRDSKARREKESAKATAARLGEMANRLMGAMGLDEKNVTGSMAALSDEVEKAWRMMGADPAALERAGAGDRIKNMPPELREHWERVMQAARTGVGRREAIKSQGILLRDLTRRAETKLVEALQRGDEAAAEQIAPVLEWALDQMEADNGEE